MAERLRVSGASVIVIILAVVATALVGSYFTAMNRDWYERLNYPAWKPPDAVIPVAWNIIFVLCAISAILVWNTRPRTARTYWTIGLFLLNAVINVSWSVLFFGNRLIFAAVIDAGVLFLSVVSVMIAAWPISRAASLLLIPYAGWVAFATALTWAIYRLNL
jgi:tryptophan-rich sensory protein